MKTFSLSLIIVLTLAAFGTFTACGATLTEAGRMVQLMKSDPPAGCVEIGPVNGRAAGMQGDPGVIDKAKNDMRNKAAKMGANYVRFETASTYAVNGTAYKCPEAPAAKSPTAK